MRFYAERAYVPAWFLNGAPTPQAVQAAGVLAAASEKGLDAADYDGVGWSARVREVQENTPLSEELTARLEAALTAALLRYISDVQIGRVDPRSLGLQLTVEPETCDLVAAVEVLAKAPDLPAAVDALEPSFHHYRRLREALVRYRALADRFRSWPPLRVPPRSLKPGDPYEDAGRLSELLSAVGDLAPEVLRDAPTGVYAEPLVGAARRFQDRHGLATDGVIGGETFAELNAGLAQRVRQIELTLERWRWLPREIRESLVVVNIPEFRLRAYEWTGQELRFAMETRVVLGKDYPGQQTPVFSRPIRRVVFSPYWEVPTRIAREELVPKLRAKPGLAEREGYVVETASGEVLPVGPNALARVEAGRARLRQKPGRRNALGRVKFLFPNEFSVYLHDTPFSELFQRPRRDFSHGCIRVEDPVALAEFVLRGEAGWQRSQIEAAVARVSPTAVATPRGPLVLIGYGTAVAEGDGRVRFFRDLYDHDAALDRALKARRSVPH